MRYLKQKQQRSKKAFFAISLLLIVIILSYAPPQTTHAQYVVTDPKHTAVTTQNTAVNTLSKAYEALSSSLQDALYIKEWTLDGIAFGLARSALVAMQKSTINWINSGFEGSPAFITDFNQFLADSADGLAGDFIYGSSLNFLCSPFQTPVRIALTLHYQQTRDYQPQCTLSEVVDNIEGFLNDDFSLGGYSAWFTMTQNPVNTPIGAYLESSVVMASYIDDQLARRTEELVANNFFLGVETCESVDTADGEVVEVCSTDTPGRVISESLSESLTFGGRSLLEADEINEVITALFAQVAQQALSGPGGLRGLGSDASRYGAATYGTSGNQSYLDAVAGAPLPVNDNPYLSQNNPIAQAVRGGETYLEAQLEIIDRVTNSESLLASFREEFMEEDEDTGNMVQTCSFPNLPPFLSRAKTNAENDYAQNSAALETLDILNEEYMRAQSTNDQQQIFNTFISLRDQGFVKNQTDTAEVEIFIDFDLIPAISDYETQLNTRANQCADENDNGNGGGGGSNNDGA